jgi:hypothetical protein
MIGYLLCATSCVRAPEPSAPAAPPHPDDGAADTVSSDLGSSVDDQVPDLGATLNPAPGPDDGGRAADIVELVSPAVCARKNTHLVDCQIGTVSLMPPAGSIPTQVDLLGHLEGNCSSAFDIELKIQADAEPAVYFYPLKQNRAITVGRIDGSQIAQLSITDVSPFRGTPVYDQSCRIWLTADWVGSP